MRRLLILLALCAVLLPSPAVMAGQDCRDAPPAPEAVRKGLQLALKTRDELERSQAKLVFIARIGSNLAEHGLRYSHAAFARREHPKGRWLVTHLLNHCGSAASELFDEGLGNFFLDDPYEYEALVVVPSPDVQERLAALLATPLPAALHVPHYSMIAHPESPRYENSNQWLLEVVAAGMAQLQQPGRAQLQRWLRETGYTGSQLRISAGRRLAAGLFRANVRFDDHAERERAAGRYEIVSVESVFTWFARQDAASRRFTVAL